MNDIWHKIIFSTKFLFSIKNVILHKKTLYFASFCCLRFVTKQQKCSLQNENVIGCFQNSVLDAKCRFEGGLQRSCRIN